MSLNWWFSFHSFKIHFGQHTYSREREKFERFFSFGQWFTTHNKGTKLLHDSFFLRRTLSTIVYNSISFSSPHVRIRKPQITDFYRVWALCMWVCCYRRCLCVAVSCLVEPISLEPYLTHFNICSCLNPKLLEEPLFCELVFFFCVAVPSPFLADRFNNFDIDEPRKWSDQAQKRIYS